MTCSSNSNMWSIAKAMKDALEATGYSELHEYQRKAIEAYVLGGMCRGAGKSLTFELAPYAFDHLFGEDCSAIVLVTVSNPNSHGIRTSYIGDDCSEEELEDILNLKEKIVLGSPEVILNNYRHIFHHLKRNHLKSLLETTFAQSKQICSFDDGDTHTCSIDLVGVESIHSAIEVKDSQMKPETPNASHATPHFWHEMQTETLQARQVDLSPLRCSQSAALRPKKARFSCQEVNL